MTNDQKSVGSVAEVFLAFLKLGLTSFGGPIAHLGYFRAEFVERRKWLSESSYADIVALCQFLPGPASSQVGFTLGILRGNGLIGGLAAWFAFTMPSALIMFAFALGATVLTGPFAEGVLHGLKLVAVAVVAQAIWGMANSLTPDRARAAIALAAVAIVVFVGGSFGQIGAIALGAAAGLWLCRGDEPAPTGHLGFSVSHRVGVIALVLFAVLFVVTPLVTARTGSQGLALFDAFYRSGALVFGGGHVVLPLLQAEVVTPGWVSNADFLAGYGMAQAVPGPLFTFAAYLGAVTGPAPNGLAGAVIALVALSLPGLRHAAVLGRATSAPRCTSRHARHQRGRRRHTGGGALQSGMDQRRARPARFRRSARRLPAADGLETSTMDRRRPAGDDRRNSAVDLNTRHRICVHSFARHARTCRVRKLKLHCTCCTAA
jgi:chromate transporter